MSGNRLKAQQIILKGIDSITKNKENVKFYEDKFAQMSDDEFATFIKDLESEKIRLSVVEPNLSKAGYVSSRELHEIIKRHGSDIMQHIYIEGKPGQPAYKSEVKYPVLLVPVQRASQSLIKKVSVPPHTRVRDLLTGQVTGESKGATLSGPEAQLLGAQGAYYCAVEKMKYAGGDIRGEAAYNAMLSKFGKANQSVLEQFSSGVQVTGALNTFLTAAMHRVNL